MNYLFIPFVIVAFLILLRLFLIIITVSGQSMSPTLNDGDRVLVVRRLCSYHLQVGQIIVGYRHIIQRSTADMTGEAFQRFFYIKRLIGLPGDKIIIDASELPRQLRPFISTKCDQNNQYVWLIPPGHCFIRGKASMSRDSVTWGTIPLETVFGIVLGQLSPTLRRRI